MKNTFEWPDRIPALNYRIRMNKNTDKRKKASKKDRMLRAAATAIAYCMLGTLAVLFVMTLFEIIGL